MIPIDKGKQPNQPGVGFYENTSPLLKASIVSSAAIASGFIPTKQGRLLDNYINAIRNVETGFPGAVLRTLRTSEFLSPLESYSSVSASNTTLQGNRYYKFLERTFGSANQFNLTKSGSIFGEVTNEFGELLGYGLQIETGGAKGAAIADYYARVVGQDLGAHESLNDAILRAEHHASKSPLSFSEWIKTMAPSQRRRRLIIGAKLRNEINLFDYQIKLDADKARRLAKFETVANLARAKAASSIGRLNTLLSSPLELPVIGGLLSKIPGYNRLMVKPGTASAMIGRLAWKGALIGAGYRGLEYVDYLRNQGSPMATAVSTVGGAALGSLFLKHPGKLFSKTGLIAGAAIGAAVGLVPRFDEGIFYGAASIYGDLSIAHAKASEAIGLTSSLQEQERVTPGLATGSAALGFGLTGGLIAGFSAYGGLLKEALFNKLPGEKFYQAAERIREREGEQLMQKFFSSLMIQKLEKVPVLKNLTKIKSPMMLGFLAGVGAWQGLTSGLSLLSGNLLAAIPGAAILGTTETSEHLQKIYSGQEEVAIRKGRWWEAGSSEWRGNRIDYFRQHALARLRSRADQIGLYGSEEERWEYDPLLHPLNAIFGSDDWKYHYEQKYQYERPAPITNGMFGDIPFIGPALSATIGNLIKPRKMIRPEDWNLGNDQYSHEFDIRGETEPAYNLGGLVPGAPARPDEPTQLFNELMYRRREMIGLPGFIEGAINKGLLGREEILPNLRTFESMGSETGSEYWLWKHLNIGGAAGSSEAIRRFIPHTRSYLDTYNPLCLLPDSEVLINNLSLIKIQDIKIGDKVYGINDTKVNNIYTREIQEEIVYGFEVFNNFNTPFFTENHPVYTIKSRYCHDHPNLKQICHKARKSKKCLTCGYNNWQEKRYKTHQHWRDYKASWIEAKNVKKDDFVGYKINKSTEVFTELDLHILLPKYNFNETEIWHSCSKHIPRYMKLNYEFGYICGLYLSEGSVNYSNNSIKFSLHSNEKDTLAKEIQSFFSKFNIKSNLYITNNKLELNVYSKPFIEIFNSLFGHGASEKYISMEIIRNAKEDFLIALLHGFIEGDGSILSHRNTIKITTKSSSLLFAFREILLSFNVVSAIHKSNLDCNILTILSSYERLFVNCCDLSFGYKIKKKDLLLKNKKIFKKQSSTHQHFILEGFLFTAVSKAVQKKYSGVVYDITVDKGNSFSTCNFLVHNSNNLPSWIPDDYFMDLKTGNPYKKIAEAEIRLPGPGYATLHPELQGLNPEDYPLAHRVKILGDIAMYSNAYSKSLSKAKAEFDTLSEKEQQIVRQTEEQVRARKVRREFNEYRFSGDRLTNEEVTVTQMLTPKRFLTKEYGDIIFEAQGVGSIIDKEQAMSMAQQTLEGRRITVALPTNEDRRYSRITSGQRMKVVPMIGETPYSSILSNAGVANEEALKDEFEQLGYSSNERLAGSISETILHGLNSPLESLTPLSPISKFIHQRSALEDYYLSQVNTESRFWDRPFENFIKPTINSALYKMGIGPITGDAQDKREINEYFDMLKWVKFSRLEAQARQEGDLDFASEFMKQKKSTVFGTDVYGSPVTVMQAIPRQERAYFDEFSNAQTDQERAAILELLPENQKRIYTAQWARQAEQAAYSRRESGIERQEDQSTIEAVALSRASQGFNFQQDDMKEWAQATGGKISFDDWMREHKAEEYFQENPLPDTDWLGWNPAVDLDDIKMKYVESAGKDFHDFDLWEARKQSLALKPYINDEIVNEMMETSQYEDSWTVAHNARTLTKTNGDRDAEIQYSQLDAGLGGTQYNITVLDGRKSLIDKSYKMIGV